LEAPWAIEAEPQRTTARRDVLKYSWATSEWVTVNHLGKQSRCMTCEDP
jgi:hypothetical protein